MTPVITVGLAGAAGVLGKGIAEALSCDERLHIVPILRPGHDVMPTAIACDLSDPDACLAATRHCDVIISAAGPAARVQPTIVRACVESGRPLLDVSARVGAPPLTDTPLVFGCGVMPGWSELLPSMMVRDGRPGADIRITFSPGGTLGKAGLTDFLLAAASESARYGAAHHHGRRVVSRPAPGHTAYLSRESEVFAHRARLDGLLVETARRPGPSIALAVTASFPDGRTKRVSASASNTAAFSIAALRLCLRMREAGRLASQALDFGLLDIDEEEGLAALRVAGLSVTAEHEPTLYESGSL